MNFSAEQAEQAFAEMDALELDVTGMQLATSEVAGATPNERMSKVCTVYQKFRPILLTVVSLFFIPRKWQDATRQFVAAMDVVCPGG